MEGLKMPNGIAWTRQEIDVLVWAVERGESLELLAQRFGRTKIAVERKADRLGLYKRATADA
jgi:hypothetical protein